jgi:sporulation-control protein spo0M
VSSRAKLLAVIPGWAMFKASSLTISPETGSELPVHLKVAWATPVSIGVTILTLLNACR